MIEINGRKFARNSAELVSTLFQSSGTAYGTYRTSKNGTKLYRANGELFAYIVHNPKQGYFAVSAGIINGRPFYMHGMTAEAERLLGFDDVPYSRQADVIRAAFNH